jgi:beta-fructofuranosidase
MAEPAHPIFYLPEDGWVGDVIPFAHDHRAYLFYLHDRRALPPTGTAWHLLTTNDFAEYLDEGVSLNHGGPADQDLNAYTGSVVEDGDRFHAFYTGQNPGFLTADGAAPAQVVMHATSDDGMRTWQKHPEHTFGPPAGYDPADWRDPFVFRPDPAGPWRMLIAARRTTGPARRRGLIAQCVSDDLVDWTAADPFWDPGRYITNECPEVFAFGDWWYLVFSEFSDRFTTRYLMSRSPTGPWQVPVHDTIDGRGFYAAKSLELNGRRYFAGWIPTRAHESDDGAWQWAGALAVHEAVQQEDGTLAFRMPTAIPATFGAPAPVEFRPVVGSWSAAGGSWRGAAPDGYAAAVSARVTQQYLLEAQIEISPGTTECGLILRASEDADEGYIVRLEPKRARMVFDRWPRRRTGDGQWQVSGDVPYAVELERPASLEPGPHTLTVLVDGTACVAYLDDAVAMSARMYDRPTGGIGIFVGEGAAVFQSVTVATRPGLT